MTPDAFKGQVSLIQEVLAALAVPVVTAEGFEADDVIATLTDQAEREGYDVAIISGDRDAFQLVSDAVTVLYPKRGVSELDRMTPAAVEARYGLTPAQYPDFAALRGDPSDNLPNIPGVGEKTAIKWIREFGSLTALVDRVEEVPGKAGDALREHLGSVLLNRRLTELVRDVPLPRDAAATSRCGPGTATRCTRSSTRCSSGCCATGSTRRSSRPSPRPTQASRSTSAVLTPGRAGPVAHGAHRRRRRVRGWPWRARGGVAPVT